ncbi:peptide-methionine (S)-S-oxide reductase [Lactiplantibacillus paraplantarum]|uniref:peptide-methionine (S)-S-oxide reductase n=1 Tax=Lactiplantibacillus paraplantarum TaxID=60520 RepID=UPI0021A90BAB|nr:peptide-methionine (S)-S-oxide reductase [Lactiplantibacillus paraplantarum]MCT4456730.1 peptide-methionine (S)-S-oxide reductase [Lactiplantibacillus paraplantarum]
MLATAIFAGGCFWCMVKPFDEQPGIKSVVAGYTGGTTVNPTYEQVASHTTGHTEAVKITFDPNVISYRPVIFVNGPEQRQVAESSRDALIASGRFNDPIVTQIEDVKPFYPAEAVHQDFYRQNPFRFQIEEMGGRAQFIKQRWQ